jgi:phage shock protein PspC (stress-responsive transcriptional regulator)
MLESLVGGLIGGFGGCFDWRGRLLIQDHWCLLFSFFVFAWLGYFSCKFLVPMVRQDDAW